MLNIAQTVPVKTRLPLAVWAVAGLVTLFSLMSTLMHADQPMDLAKANNGHVMASAIR